MDTLKLIADILPEALKTKGNFVWMVGRLKESSRNTGNMFTETDAVVLLEKWLAEYPAYVRTFYWAAKPEGDKGCEVKGFRNASEAWEASLTLARARADAQYE